MSPAGRHTPVGLSYAALPVTFRNIFSLPSAVRGGIFFGS
jgi:hypothetical protein